MTQPLLVVDEIRKRFGRMEALKGVSFSVAEGELFGLLGPNGAGKTTLISILSCLLSPTGGSARLGEKSLRMSDADIRRQIGLVPQDLAIYGELTARENLVFFGKLYDLPKIELSRRVDEVLTAIGLDDRADDRVQTFSGGMKRRLNLGVSIMHSPRLLFLDEPTTGVDPQSRNRIFEEVRRLNNTGTTIVYTSHYMEEVHALCPRVGILDHGQLIACDLVAHLLLKLNGQIRFHIDPVPPTLVDRLHEMPGVTVDQPNATQFVLTATDVPKSLMKLTATFADLKVEPDEIEAHEPNLERVFLDLTGRGLRD
jgi:ABC-2 type transport system ATP-binding protein